MSEEVFKQNRKVLLRIFKERLPVFTENQLFTFIAEIRRMKMLYRKVYTYDQLEDIFLFKLIPKLGE